MVSVTLPDARLDLDELGLATVVSPTVFIGASLAVTTLVGLAFAGPVGALAVVATPVGLAIVHRVAASRRTRWARVAVIDLCRQLGREIASGTPPAAALPRLVADDPVLAARLSPSVRAVAAQIQSGHDALRSLDGWMASASDLHERRVALALRLAIDSGADITAGLDRVADDIRLEHELDDRRDALTAQSRMQAWMLVSLPLVFGALTTMLRGSALPSDPLSIIALTVGVGLDLIGLWWLNRLSRAVERHADAEVASLPDVVMVLRLAEQTGATVRASIACAATHARGAAADALELVSRRVAAGADLRDAVFVLEDSTVAARLGDLLVRSERHGDRFDLHLEWLIRDLRRERAAAMELAAQRASITALAPLVLCVLPAFVLISFVPLVLSALGDLSL